MTPAPGETKPRIPDSCCFVIFGVTGDLAHRLVIPALYNLAEAKLLPEKFCVVGVTRTETQSKTLTADLMAGLKKFATRPVDAQVAQQLFGCMTSIHADPSEPDSFAALAEHLHKIAEQRGITNFLFYLAVPPAGFKPISEALGHHGLLREAKGAWRRLVVEKPFGTDLKSAKQLNHDLLALLNEHQIYRIDHYLGKETVQNILVFRFANGMFEPIWNRNHIDHVQITVSETLDVGRRGSFYEATGALRDMVPNHLFQLLALVAMEPPSRFDAHSVRSEKGEALAAIQTQSEAEALQNSVRGQYRAGQIGEREVIDYRKTQNVAPGSVVETYAALKLTSTTGAGPACRSYAALKLTIDNWRWAGVPFCLRTGKRMPEKRTSVSIQFKPVPHSIFGQASIHDMTPNRLVIDLQPDEDISLTLMNKAPGLSSGGMRLQSLPLSLSLLSTYEGAGGRRRIAYERLLLDAIQGDATLFVRRDEVEEGWRWVDGVADAWAEARLEPKPYAAGSWGPSGAFALIERFGKAWSD